MSDQNLNCVGTASSAVIKEDGPKVGSVLVVGGGVGGIQAALDLAESGYFVYLAEETPAIGGVMARLDKTFPTNDCSMCILSPKLVECGRHLNIKIIPYSEIQSVDGSPGNFSVKIKRHASFVDPVKCTGCSECAQACPVEVPNEFEEGLTNRKAIYRPYPQAVPNVFTIDKIAKAPCRDGCPAGINVQGYVALIGREKHREALDLIRENLPLPGVIGRVCPHPCETVCNRTKIDEPLSICSLKRYAADQAGSEFVAPAIEKREEKVAIIGSGPAGLTCAYFLALKGFSVTIFEALPVAGGMLRVGIPDYRLPPPVIESEIEIIKKLGVEIKTNTPVSKGSIDTLLSDGYKAVFIAAGSHRSMPLDIPGEDTKGVIPGVEFLRTVSLGKKVAVGKKVAIIGGGDVAIDAARTSLRMGAEQVSIIYRRSRREMPASADEIESALYEGIAIEYLAAPVRVVAENNIVKGLACVRMKLGSPDMSGRRRPVPIEGSEFILDVDTIIPAIGQLSDLSFLSEAEEVKCSKHDRIIADSVTLATSRTGVFAGGDCVSGPWIAIEAVAAGKRAAISIERFLNGQDLKSGREKPPAVQPSPELEDRFMHKPKAPRQKMAHIPNDKRKGNFTEVELGFTREEALKEAERCLNCGICSECMQCVAACKAGAIDHSFTEKIDEINVGSVILSPGFDEFRTDAEYLSQSGYTSLISQYGYSKYPNVLTSIEFERILSASGPYEGHLLRPSDKKPPKKIAWIQCIGSRDEACDSGYCSSVCCMYAIKEAVIAKEHSPTPLDVTIFYMDMRTYGKDFDKYYERARDEHGIHFVRSKVYGISEPNGNGNLAVRYAEEGGAVRTDEFDMVTLSVGLKPRKTAVELAGRLGIDLNHYNFCKTDGFTPVNTSRDGIYVCGAFQGPKDIPETVMQASGAAAASAALLSEARGTLVQKKAFPPEKIITGDPPRIGVFVCHCGINIGGVVNVAEVKKYAATLPNVAYVEENMYTCSQDTQEAIKEKIEKHRLNRVVVASCSPRTHEPLFQETIQEQGLNKYLFEMANIRDQCSWVHQKEPANATQKAKDLVRMAVSKTRLAQPLQQISLKTTPVALVMGGGISGMVSALNLADQGFEVHLVEKGMTLGGMAKKIHFTLEGGDVQAYLKELIEKVTHHPKIQVYLRAAIAETSGYIGNFVTKISFGTKKEVKEVKHGAVVIATGADEAKTADYLYKKHRSVVSLLELEGEVVKQSKRIKDCQTLVMIQCAGSRDKDRPYCSRVCCSDAVKNALLLKELNPQMQIYILYRDMRTYGLKEDFYRKARQKGVLFIHYEADTKPEIVPVKDGAKEVLRVTVQEPLLGEKIVIDADLVSLALGTEAPAFNKELSQYFKVPLNQDGFFLEAHMKLRPVEFATDGVFMCGLAHSPKFIEESIAQAQAAASRAGAVLSREIVELPGTISFVNPNRCAGCGVCVSVCPFNAIAMDTEKNIAQINDALCKGCGACTSSCKSGAINLYGFTNTQIMTVLDAL